MDRSLLIVNPRSGGGLSPEKWARVSGPILRELGACDTRFTEGPGDGRRLAAEEACAGRKLVIAVGGDGTISEVAGGLLEAGTGAELGIVPRGTGGDFRRSLELPDDPGEAARRLRESKPRRIDVGRATLTAEGGAQVTRHFVNVASFGFSSVVARTANASSKRLGGRIAYLSATVRSLMTYDNVDVVVTCDGGEPRRRTVLLGAVGNGRFFGGGMKICPDARLDDGLLDFVAVGDLGRFQVLTKVGRLYDGSHVSMPDVDVVRARVVEVALAEPGREIPVELDGEIPGGLPARFEIVPGALAIRA